VNLKKRGRLYRSPAAGYKACPVDAGRRGHCLIVGGVTITQVRKAMKELQKSRHRGVPIAKIMRGGPGEVLIYHTGNGRGIPSMPNRKVFTCSPFASNKPHVGSLIMRTLQPLGGYLLTYYYPDEGRD
jgi:hypothetical protein